MPENLHYNETVTPQEQIQEALDLGYTTGNALLLDYCDQLIVAQNMTPPEELVRRRKELSDNVAEGATDRWLDTALTGHDEEVPPAELVAAKIDRTIRQIHEHQAGAGFMCYVLVPALNEEESISDLIRSLRDQVSDTPLALVVADNNSTDGTAHLTRAEGGNVIPAARPGVGPARQCAIDHALMMSPTDFDHTILLQTDADCIVAPGCVQSAVDAFAAKPDMRVGVGPSIYVMPHEDGSVVRLSSGKDYGRLLGTKGIRAYFESLGRNAADYLIDEPFRYLIGPNTSFRASVLTETDLRYPDDGRWETLDLSIRLQRRFPSSSSIQYVQGQKVHVSSRAILGDRPYLTAERLTEIRQAGYVGMYRSEGVAITPEDTVRRVIRELDAQTYSLGEHEIVIAIADIRDSIQIASAASRTTPALHAATGALLLNKIAIIAHQ
jgi:hypothetical protein